MKNHLSVLFCCICFLGSQAAFSQPERYIDGRPAARHRIDCNDQGVVMHYGDGKDSCDVYGSREAVLNKVGETYYLFYDGAGKDGWKACLATSADLTTWTKKGAILELGDSTKNDAKSASSPWVINDKNTWHMFYLGTPNATPAPDRIPAFPYLTMKAKASSIEGPWIKQYDVQPFTTKLNTFYALTASPGFIVRYKDEFLQFFSGSANENKIVKRTIGLARTRDLNSTWNINETPVFPLEEQIENSSLYYDKSQKTWYLFTNHIGINKEGVEFTDAIWVYWTKDIFHWQKENKAIVLDKQNCSWSKGAIGMPTVIQTGNRLALLYDAAPGESISHMRRNIGLAWISLPIQIHK
ncbi:glycoside hydrolase family protein [Spirosoma knui]